MKKIFVNGNIIINTPVFCYKELTALSDPIDDADEYIDGDIEYNDDNPQSIFNEYYASLGISSYCLGVEYFFRTIDDVYLNFTEKISDIRELLALEMTNDKTKGIINRLSYVSIVAAMETFICDTLLVFIVRDEDIYNKSICYIQEKSSYSEKEKIQKMLEKGLNTELERYIIDEIMKKPFSRIDIIKEMFKYIIDISVHNVNGVMNSILYNRHLIAHKNGRKKDGSYIKIEIDDLETVITDISTFVKTIYDDAKATELQIIKSY